MEQTSKGFFQIRTDIEWKVLWYILLLFPFFEPMSIETLENKAPTGTAIWKGIGILYLLLRVLFATSGGLLFIKKIMEKKIHLSRTRVCLAVCLALWFIACLFNHSTDAQSLAFVYQNLGFCLLCFILADQSPKSMFNACRIMFGALSIIGVISIYLFPKGFFDAVDTNNAVYFLGGKNGSFPFYYFFFFSSIVSSFLWGTRRDFLLFDYFMVFLAVLICQSANSLLCVLLIALTDILFLRKNRILLSMKPKVVLAVLATSIILIYIGSVFTPFVNLLEKLGRTTTFSGRDVLWAQALEYIKENPFWGKGKDVSFVLRDMRDAVHAHSQYLHRIATYGLIPFVFFVIGTISLFRRPFRKRIMAVHTIQLLTIIYLLHMSFDTYVFYFVILLIVLSETAMDQTKNKDTVIVLDQNILGDLCNYLRNWGKLE